jgi:hypothetical protein
LAGNTQSITGHQSNIVPGGYLSALLDIGILGADGSQFAMTCAPNEVIIGSAFTASHRCKMSLYLQFLDASGASLLNSESALQNSTENLTNVLAEPFFHRPYVKATAPAGTTSVRMLVRKYNTEGGTESYYWIAAPMLERASANQQGPSPYQPGPASNTRQLGYIGSLNADVTAANISAGFIGQGAFATLSSAAYGSSFLTGFGGLAPLNQVAIGSTGRVYRDDGVTRLTDALAVTSVGTAAGIAGQGAFATASSAAYGSSFLTGFGALAPLNQVAIGPAGRIYRDDGVTRLTDALAVTSVGTAAGIAGQGSLATLNSVNPATNQVLSFGSTPPMVPDNSFAYTSTTNSITITWPAFTIYRPDGTTIAISAGSQVITGLSANTWRIYAFAIDTGATTANIGFSTGGSGSPTIAHALATFVPAAAQMYLRGNIALGSFNAVVPSSGGGGGGGGGSACLHPDMVISNGLVADDAAVGSLIETPTGLKPIVRLERRLCSEWYRVETEAGFVTVTADHRFIKAEGGECRARDLKLGMLLVTSGDHAEVTGLLLRSDTRYLVQIELDDPHLYYLGPANLLCHNIKP